MVECLRRREVECLGLGIVKGLHILLELFFQGIILIQEDGIGDVERHLVVHFRQSLNEFLAILVYGFDAALMEAQRLLQLLFCLTCCSIVHHP